MEPTAPAPAIPGSPVADSSTTLNDMDGDDPADAGRPAFPEQPTARGRAIQPAPGRGPCGPIPIRAGFTAAVDGWEWSGSWIPKPGVIALRPLTFGDLMGASLAVLRRNWRTTLLLSGCIALITQAVASTASRLGVSSTATFVLPTMSTANTATLLHQEVQLLKTLFPVLAVTLPITVFTAVLGGALSAPVVSRAVLGKGAPMAEVWPEIRPQLPSALGLATVVTVALSAITGLFLAPAIAAEQTGASDATVLALGTLAVPGGLAFLWLYVSLLLAGPALVLEHQTLRSAMTRSLRLVRGAWWRIFALTLLATLLVDLVTGLLISPTVVADLALTSSDSTSTTGFVPTAVVGVLSSTLTIPVTSAFSVLLYVDQRIRREALDLELARAAGVPLYGH